MRNTARLMTVVVALSASSVFAADWPSIYGPAGNSTSDQKGLLRTWPEAGPKLLWTAPVGAGFGGPAVSDGKVYLLDRDEKVGDKLRVFDLVERQGALELRVRRAGRVHVSPARGPHRRSTASTSTPSERWETCTPSTPGRRSRSGTRTSGRTSAAATLPRWAIVQNPLIYGNLLIVAPQTSQAGVVAYDKLTGELKWKSAPLSGTTGYVSPSIAKVGGEDHLVMVTASVGRGRNAKDGSVNGLDPRSGKVLWTYTNWQCPIPVPQAVDAGDGRVLITGGYSAGTAMIKVEKKGDGSYGVTELFKNPDFGAHTQPPILHDDHFYSHYTINERSDGLVAMSIDGQVKWKTDQQPPFVRGGSILADGLLLTTDGDTKLYLVEPNPSSFKPLASAVVLEKGDNWAPLALVDGKLLVRGQKELKCLQVAQ